MTYALNDSGAGPGDDTLDDEEIVEFVGSREQTGFATMSGGYTGVSFRSSHDPRSGVTITGISNTGAGVGALTRALGELLV